MSEPRQIDTSIDIRASPEAVWKALTEADEIARWFALTAETVPGVGGSINLHWGAEVNWPTTIRVWDPPRHVRVEDHYPVIKSLAKGERAELFIDYFIEPLAGGMTRLRVVHSGFDSHTDWNGLYDSTGCGWRCEIAALRYYLERCGGQSRDWVWVVREFAGSVEEAFTRMMGEQGLSLAPREAAMADTAQPITARGSWRSAQPEGLTLLRSAQNRAVVFAPDGVEGVLAMMSAEPPQEPGGKRVAMVRFNLYGAAGSMKHHLTKEWESRLARMFE